MNILPLFVAIPLGSAFFILLMRDKKLSDFWANLTTVILSLLSLSAIWLVRTEGVIVYKVGNWMPPAGIPLVLDGLTVLFLVTVNLIALSVTIYSLSYMEQYTAKNKFYCLFLLMVAGMNGVIITGDMFNLFVFLEIASVVRSSRSGWRLKSLKHHSNTWF